MTEEVDAPAMFFAGLILLIPHRIGMSRVNYVIKRYNLPISRAGLLLYKYHNNIELSLLCGTFNGCVLNWTAGMNNVKSIYVFILIFLFFMLFSSIIMYIIYVSGGDFGHLNAFYFSLIFLTIVDGFTNAFAFALNPQYSSLLSAGIPLSGLLVTLLHYIYKSHSDYYHSDDFDYYVLRLQLLCNIIIIFITFILWIVNVSLNWGSAHAPELNLSPLFDSTTDGHYADFLPIGLLAISLGTVYAFYPSIAPYSIIDYQYATIIELWILVISALLPLLFAILDTITKFANTQNALGPSGKLEFHWKNSESFPTTSTSTTCTYDTDVSGKNKTGGVTHNWVSSGLIVYGT